MSGRDFRRLDDPDDWFAEPDRPAPPSGRSPTAIERPTAEHDKIGGADNWLDGEPASAPPGRFMPGATFRLRTALILVVIALAVVVAGLAVGGVFSGGKHHATTPTTTPRSTTQSRSNTPTTPARPTRRVPPAPAATLKPGDQGVQVKLLQRALARLGYQAGTVDGIYGSSTRAAVTRFQKASTLTADGVLGPKTLQALKLALRRSG